MVLFLAFLLVPLIEIALFIQVGGAIGLWPTLGIVVLTAILGTWLVRTQGLIAIGQLRRSFAELDDPTEPLAHGAMILIAGVLLLTPGFFTDAIGFALLVPAFRSAVFRHIRARMVVTGFRMGPEGTWRAYGDDLGRGPEGGDVIDGEFEEIRPRQRPRRGPSGWIENDRH